MKIAILSDIHGNSIGLDAVLQHITDHGKVDAYWFLGGYCFGGGDPIGVLERINDLPNTTFIRGNSDRYLVNPTLPPPSEIPPDRIDWLFEVTRDQYWTIGAVSQSGWLDWLAALPAEKRIKLSCGTSVLLVHSYPGSDEDPGLNPTQSDETVRELFGTVEETLIFVGHTHTVQERRIDDKHIINVGCIGKPINEDTRATYALMDVDDTTYNVKIHHVEYDTKAVIQQMVDRGYPGADFMEQFYRGEYIHDW